MMKIENCEIGSSPSRCADTATPLSECVCTTQPTSWRAACTALWIVKPAGFTGYGESSILLPFRSILIRLEAVISSNISP